METTDEPFQPYPLKDLGGPWACAPQSTIHTLLPVQCHQFLPQKPNPLSIFPSYSFKSRISILPSHSCLGEGQLSQIDKAGYT